MSSHLLRQLNMSNQTPEFEDIDLDEIFDSDFDPIDGDPVIAATKITSQSLLPKKKQKITTTKTSPTPTSGQSAVAASAPNPTPTPNSPVPGMGATQAQSLAKALASLGAVYAPVKDTTAKAPTKEDGPNLLSMMHAILDACGDGESVVITKFKDDGTIKLRFGYNIATQTAQKTVKAPGIKEACLSVLKQLIGDRSPKAVAGYQKSQTPTITMGGTGVVPGAVKKQKP